MTLIIKRLNNRKACGPDNIPVAAVKALHRHHPTLLPRLFTACLSAVRYGSAERALSRGCPQGSILGPTLWNVIHDAAIRHLEPLCNGLVCFADDTLLILGANSPPALATRCEGVLQAFSTVLAAHGLQLNVAKTEFLVFRNIPLRVRRRRPQLEADPVLRMAGTVLTPSPAMRYLGVHLDPKLSFNHHLAKVKERCTRSLLLLRRLCPNVYGYHPAARKIMARGVVHTHLYYCSSVWYTRLKLKHPRGLVLDIQRRCDRMVISGYRTISGSAASVIAASPPLDILLVRRSILWLRSEDLPVPYWGPFPLLETAVASDNGDAPALLPPPSDWHRTVVTAWQQRWDRCATGRWTYQLFPSIEDRLKLQFVHTFWRTQGLSGHGVFGQYLSFFKRRASPACFCGYAEETAEHVFRHCPLFVHHRP
ncbi:unnamed protein product, partial [Brugia timori]